MASHNTRPDFVFHKTPPAKSTKKVKAEFVSLTLLDDELTVESNFSKGGDPYNSTGQHVVTKRRKKIWPD